MTVRDALPIRRATRYSGDTQRIEYPEQHVSGINLTINGGPVDNTPQPERYNRHGEPVFPRIPTPGRGWDRCEDCSRTGVTWRWADNTTGETIDEHDDNTHLEVLTCTFCTGQGWLPPAPARPKRLAKPGPDWFCCTNCAGRGGYYVEDEAAPANGKPRWSWQKCEDCAVDPDDDRNGLGWWPPEIGTPEDQDEQVRLAYDRLYG